MIETIYKEKYVDNELLDEIKIFYSKVGDALSGGPVVDTTEHSTIYGKDGCADRPLRLEFKKNPIHKLIGKLKADMGDFHIHEGSIRYLYYPFGPHSDVRTSEHLLESRKRYRDGYTFLIPLQWKDGCTPGTAFFDSPPKEDQQLMIERPDVIPQTKNPNYSKNFGIKQLIPWKNPGDLVGWMNYQYHSSMIGGDWVYNDSEWCKEFISIETFRFKE
tara:strand:- start:992 stop:1642 length:651 start_codon:yes stop_codon:yes gene_type:complete